MPPVVSRMVILSKLILFLFQELREASRYDVIQQFIDSLFSHDDSAGRRPFTPVGTLFLAGSIHINHKDADIYEVR